MLMGGSINDPKLQLGALRDLGALPPDTDLDAVVRDFGLDRPPQDAAAMAPDELLGQIRDLTKQLLAYGARFPKVLMLFVKDLLFLDGALATLAPDIDLFAEVTQVATYFTARYGARIAADIGIDPRANPVDMDSVRAGLGVGGDVDTLTYRDLQARRELIRRRMEDHHRDAQDESSTRRRPFRRS
jgi:ubiquinone biosynthesis protein